MILRCTSHRRYFGRPSLYGMSALGGGRLTVSDGMCPTCSRRWQIESGSNIIFSSPPLIPRSLPRVGLAIAIAAGLLFAARPLDRAFTTARTPAVLPTTVTASSGEAGHTSGTAAESRTPVSKSPTSAVASSVQGGGTGFASPASASRSASEPGASDTIAASPATSAEIAEARQSAAPFTTGTTHAASLPPENSRRVRRHVVDSGAGEPFQTAWWDRMERVASSARSAALRAHGAIVSVTCRDAVATAPTLAACQRRAAAVTSPGGLKTEAP